MSPNEIARLQAYLQAKFNNNMIKLVRRPKAKDSVEVVLGEEFLGVVYRDDGTKTAFRILMKGHSFVTHDRHLLENLHETLIFLMGKK